MEIESECLQPLAQSDHAESKRDRRADRDCQRFVQSALVFFAFLLLVTTTTRPFSLRS